jgi:hypothetical protein
LEDQLKDESKTTQFETKHSVFIVLYRAPILTYALIALFTIGTMGLSNAAVMRLNYPTHMMFKSCKLIPVMIGSMLILGRYQVQYSLFLIRDFVFLYRKTL